MPDFKPISVVFILPFHTDLFPDYAERSGVVWKPDSTTEGKKLKW